MAKQQKNMVHKESIRRKNEAKIILSEIGLCLSDDTRSIGIVLEHVGVSQLSFCALRNIEKASKRYSGLDINIFVQKTAPFATEIMCPVFHIRDVISWDEPLITTDISTTIDALNSSAPIVLYYVYDLDFVYNTRRTIEDVRNAFCNERIIVITRTKEYRNIIQKEFGIDVLECILSDFDIVEMAKIIFGRQKNGSTIQNVKRTVV